MQEFLTKWFIDIGLSDLWANIMLSGIFVVAAVIISIIADLIAGKIIIRLIGNLVKKTATTWDNVIFEQGVLNRLSRLAPALVVYFFLPLIFISFETIGIFLQRIVIGYMIGISIFVLDSILNAVVIIYRQFEISKRRPIKGYIQILKVFIFLIGGILIVTTLLNKSAWGLLSGIGALSAVIMLVFKDSILGIVSSVQLSGNNMLRIGDWVEVPSAGADGDVVDITLQHVTIQNWDKTLVTVPLYNLVSSSFKNWRGMSESGGRRIKRSIHIDVNSIKFCDDEMLDKFHSIAYLKEYLAEKVKEIRSHNEELGISGEELVNGRHLTNIGTFRAYLYNYLKNHPKIHNSMTFLIRHLPPGPNGLPIEIYVFSNDQVWANYEAIQADIFDHILAVIPFFGLAVYQNPSSYDLRHLNLPTR